MSTTPTSSSTSTIRLKRSTSQASASSSTWRSSLAAAQTLTSRSASAASTAEIRAPSHSAMRWLGLRQLFSLPRSHRTPGLSAGGDQRQEVTQSVCVGPGFVRGLCVRAAHRPAIIFSCKNKQPAPVMGCLIGESQKGIEPLTCSLRVSRSTPELFWHCCVACAF